MSKAVVLKGPVQVREGTAGGAFKAGNLLKIDTDGDIIKLGTAVGVGQPLLVAALQDEIGRDFDATTYASGDRVRYYVPQAGTEMTLRVGASAPAIVVGDNLTTSTTGTVLKATSSSNIIGVALEAVDNSSGTKEVTISVAIAY